MSTMITDLFKTLDTTLTKFVHNGYDALLSSDFKAAMFSLITIYIAWIGWKTINHWQGFSAGQFVKEVLKIAVVYSIATDWAFFSTYIYNVLTNAPSELASVLMKSAGSAYDSSYTALQKVFDEGVAVGSSAWSKGNWRSWLPLFVGLDIWFIVGALTGTAIVMICVAKSFLAMLLVLTPIFVYFLLSESFKGITESWFKLTLGFALMPLMVNVALLFTNSVMETSMDKVTAILGQTGLTEKNVEQFMPAMIGFDIWMIMCTILVLKSASLAAQMGGGIAVTGMEKLPAIAAGFSKAMKFLSEQPSKSMKGNKKSRSRWQKDIGNKI